MMIQQGLQHQNSLQPEPVLEYVLAIESENSKALQNILQQYRYRDDIMAAFRALHIIFHPELSFVGQLVQFRTTGKVGGK